MKKQTGLFPGQGSQHTGMGAELFPLYPAYVMQANAILGYDLVELCLNNPENRLQQTNFTQPALYVVNALSYLKHQSEQGTPDWVMGHSLGEFNALFAAGVFDFETGLRLVQKRGELMANCEKGGMAAVIGLDRAEIEVIVQDHLPDLDIANVNSARQIVVSGPVETIAQAGALFEAEFATYIPLKVGGAFHSRYMLPAQKTYERFLKGFQFKDASIPVMSNVLARPYGKGQTVELLTRQMTSPVKWYESIKYLLEQGDGAFFEIGPGAVLQNLMKKILQD